MPLNFRIFPQHGLCIVEYRGRMAMDESAAVFERYLQHPDYRPGQKQLIALDQVTEIATDFPGLMKLQAQKAGHLHSPQWQTLIAYLASTPRTLRFAHLIQRSWEGIDGVVARVFTDDAAALSFLGVPAGGLAELTAQAGPDTGNGLSAPPQSDRG
jgi:hypothetical protein